MATETAELDLREQIARIDRMLSPWVTVVAVAGGVGGVIAGVQAIVRALHG